MITNFKEYKKNTHKRGIDKFGEYELWEYHYQTLRGHYPENQKKSNRIKWRVELIKKYISNKGVV
jgi:hypothetical protein